jgi:Utp13 specific WD40 associated domain
MAVLDDEPAEKKGSKGKKSVAKKESFADNIGSKLDCFTSTWSDEDLEKIVLYLKEWNTNAKHSFVSQAVLNRLAD